MGQIIQGEGQISQRAKGGESASGRKSQDENKPGGETAKGKKAIILHHP